MTVLFLNWGMFLILGSLSSFWMGLNYLNSGKVNFLEFNFLEMNSCSMNFIILVDWISLIFTSFVMFISCMVVLYSQEYMGDEVFKKRFILLVLGFVFSMMLMIMSPNLISILLGWDGLGLISYCLVIYYQNVKSFNAGMLTVLSNRIGDIFILLSIAWMMNYGSWNFLFYLNLNDYSMKLIFFMVTLAAFTKSAQIPFSSWLPAAMAAPTPVSALVHSSTLVTAGVYLLIRFNISLEVLNWFILLIGILTMFMSGIAANMEVDLKKIIALSTLSQLGLMMSILGVGSSLLAFFHLLTHALFKALLFMCAGSLIHMMANFQDIRFMGGLVFKLPLTLTLFNVSNLSLCGLPFLSGFYSKDLILEFFSFSFFNFSLYLLFLLSLGLTVSYSVRLTFYLLFNNFSFLSLNQVQENFHMILKSSLMMFFVMLFSGSSLNWLLLEVPFFIFLPFLMKIMAFVFIFLGFLLGMNLMQMNLNWYFYFLKLKIHFYLVNMWNLTILSVSGLNYMFLQVGLWFSLVLDQGWFEFYSGKGIVSFMSLKTLEFQYFLKNFLKFNLIFMFLWICLIFIMY
uniref:NADH-ubiquinone oxidoreductase chain 5 n=1 Tax=Rodolia quadrimaculata TaxID=2678939 RepID=A0A6B9MR59_9CUCU|nr:NADH dehydrogenase subunit 5 [Rodolia quadrimaculata]